MLNKLTFRYLIINFLIIFGILFIFQALLHGFHLNQYDYGYVLLIAFFPMLGGFIAYRVRLKPLMVFLFSARKSIPGFSPKKTLFSDSNISIDELKIALESAGMKITFVDKEKNMLKFCEHLTCYKIGHFAKIEYSPVSTSIILSTYNSKEENAKAYYRFRTHTIKLIETIKTGSRSEAV